jgi:two-component system cell cycle response regulator DivK
MPVLNGYELAGRLLATPTWRRVPLVALSAFPMRKDRAGALADFLPPELRAPAQG